MTDERLARKVRGTHRPGGRGGLESPVGALVGGLITGLCISYVGGYLGSGVEPAGALVLLIAALMVRPEGIFSRPPARRV